MHVVRILAQHRRYIRVHTAHIRWIYRLVHSRQSSTHTKQTNKLDILTSNMMIETDRIMKCCQKKGRCYYGMNTNALLILFYRLGFRCACKLQTIIVYDQKHFFIIIIIFFSWFSANRCKPPKHFECDENENLNFVWT